MSAWVWLLLGIGLGTGACTESDRRVNLPEKVFPSDTLRVEDCLRCLVLTEQARPSIRIVETLTGNTVWEWQPAQAEELEDPAWFSNPDEAKPVYDRKYLLVTASGGGVALIRIADKKVVFSAYAGGNPHSAELFPDGNLAVASSTGNYLTIFRLDTAASSEAPYKQQHDLPSGHNVVWDRKREVLWSAAKNKLYSFVYNFDCERPDVILQDSLPLPGNNAHDLFPVFGKDSLWLTNTSDVYLIDLKARRTFRADVAHREHIKSVSSGPEDYPVILLSPEESWWSDKVRDTRGEVIFEEKGFRIYKARWFLPNAFSYPEKHVLGSCK